MVNKKYKVNDKPLRIFISATGQNAGKTTFSLGIIAALLKRFKSIGFIKPIGQRYLMEQGFKVDEDSVLIEKIFGMSHNLSIKDLSPVAVERGFTEKYIEGNVKTDYAGKIVDSFNKVAHDNELVIIEGTGHTGVGSVFDLSNATVAKLLNSKVILLTPGGVGRPIDETMLNKPLFDKEGVELIGAVVNKVLPEKFKRIEQYVRKGFERKNIPVVGVMPYQRRLDLPTIREIREEMGFEILCGEKHTDVSVEKILVGAMEVEIALRYVEEGTLMITATDRLDIIKGIVDIQEKYVKKGKRAISGLVLSGKDKPEKKILELLEEARIATIFSGVDTYSTASKINEMNIKIKPEDKQKIDIIIKMVAKYVDVDKIIKNIGG